MQNWSWLNNDWIIFYDFLHWHLRWAGQGRKFDIQEGEVTSIKKDKVKVCEAGKLVEKEKSEVPAPYKIGCNGETIR